MTTATETRTTGERISARLATLTKQRAAIPEEGQLPLSMTRDEAAALGGQAYVLDRRIANVHTASIALAALGSTEADQQWLDFLPSARATLSAELLAIKSPIRDRETMERARRLEWSIALIDHGFKINSLGPILSLASAPIGLLMAASGFAVSGPELRGPNGWRGSIKEVEQRIKELSRRRVEAEEALDEALIDDDARAKREAEDEVFRAAIGTMRLKGSADNDSLRAFTTDGDPLDVADMTPAQRKAFERFRRTNASQSPREMVSS